ncbi:molybdopterin molybdotransferase MoeA [Spelaeicoccus albus]|uniref:Molybdopterin molybdenumtransferase n=1 Tax=Spelaeicoccus albus TaxID=1280376 RepID=A0A7Z0A7K2_9MICO|nr:gephyrin-like molybdotransferase Glp [Spelaeicoccus albus]NYI65894.1 molybdopterin molybdotransferase [Spelaeicoccus albus]
MTDDNRVGPPSVADHRERVGALLPALAPELMQLTGALGSAVAETIAAGRDLPIFDNSQMDGFAVRVADVTGVGAPGSRLTVVGDIAAGSAPDAAVEPGTAIRIMTGAPIPDGADAVVPVEWTDAPRGSSSAPDDVRATVPDGTTVTPGLYIRSVGADVRADETVLERGSVLDARAIGMLAALGYDRVPVFRRPRVVVMATGTELVAPGSRLEPGQIFESNGQMLVAAFAEIGIDAELVAAVSDDADELRRILGQAASRADLIVTSGGVSAGAYDVVKDVLRRGDGMWFGHIAMQPGGPQGAGTIDAAGRAVPVLCLPGNPVSTFVSFELFIRPAVLAMTGRSDLDRAVIRARVAEGFDSVRGKTQIVRAVVRAEPDGVPTVSMLGGHGSHLLTSLARANALMPVPADTVRVEAGDELDCVMLSTLPGGSK